MLKRDSDVGQKTRFRQERHDVTETARAKRYHILI